MTNRAKRRSFSPVATGETRARILLVGLFVFVPCSQSLEISPKPSAKRESRRLGIMLSRFGLEMVLSGASEEEREK